MLCGSCHLILPYLTPICQGSTCSSYALFADSTPENSLSTAFTSRSRASALHRGATKNCEKRSKRAVQRCWLAVKVVICVLLQAQLHDCMPLVIPHFSFNLVVTLALRQREICLPTVRPHPHT